MESLLGRRPYDTAFPQSKGSDAGVAPRGSGSTLKVLRLIAMLSLLVATGAAAQTPRLPAPMPLFKAPVVSGAQSTEALPLQSTDLPAGAIPLPVETATDAIATVTADPQPVRLTAYATDGGRTLGEGVVWRVFTTRTDGAGRLELAAESNSPVADVELAPGN